MFVCLFVCLFNRLLRAETHLGADGTRLKQNAQARPKSLYKHAGQLVYENIKIWRYEMKEKRTTATPNKSSWTILLSAFCDKRKEILYPISNATEAGVLLTIYLCYTIENYLEPLYHWEPKQTKQKQNKQTNKD